MLGEMEKLGFDLVRTLYNHFLRLYLWILALVLLSVWRVSIGPQTICYGLRHFVDRKD